MKRLTCIAVDDEPLALRLLERFIEQTPFLELVGSYSGAIAALRALQQQGRSVDVLFLDIQMPDLNGLELARVLAGGPRVVFTTAFNQYALEGYKVDALDYLLKPFIYEDFLRAARKAQAYVELRHSAAPVPTLPATDTYLYLKVDYQLVRVEFDDILYVESLKDYVKVYLRTESRPLLSLMSLKMLEERLPSTQFMRLHRSYLVSLKHVKYVQRGTVQIGNVTIPVGNQYREAFEQYFNRWR